jgi:hypothetical protein
LIFPRIFFITSVILLKNARQDWARADLSPRTMLFAKNCEELRLLFHEIRHDAALQELERCQTQHAAQNLKRNLLDASHIQLGWYEPILQMSIRVETL